MKAIELHMIMTSIRAKSDGSMGLSISTPELTPEEKVEIMRLQNLNLKGILYPLDHENVPVYKIEKELESKTPSERLRNALFVLWDQYGRQGEFNDFYKDKMETIIDKVKDKLSDDV